MKKLALLYTMESCPFCTEMKGLLKENKIKYIERDIDEHNKEYEDFVKKTKNDYLPAFSILTVNEKKEILNVEYVLPDENFKDLNEAVDIVKNRLL